MTKKVIAAEEILIQRCLLVNTKTDCTWKLKIQEVVVKFRLKLLDLLEIANMSGSVIGK